MKKILFKNIFSTLIVVAMLSQQTVTVFAQLNDGYTGSPVYNDGYTGSPVYNDGYTGSPVYNDGYTGSPVYNDGYTGSPVVYNDGYVGTSPSYSYTPAYSYTPSYSYDSSYTTTPSYTYGTTYTSPTYDYGTSYTYPTYNYTQPTNTVITVPGTNTYICSNGSTPVNGSCNTVTTIPGTNTTVCSDGSTPVNGSCNHTTTIPTTTTTVCSNGQAPVNGTCAITNTIPTTSTTICSDGSYPVNGSCNRTTTIPTTVNTLCSDGLPRNYDGTCVRNNVITATQVCSNGSVIPVNQTCPSAYKYCANGSYVAYNQSCFGPITPVYSPTVVKFNNVVTSVATQITNTSGRCNGIGLIANGAASTGWFEYGETANLGRVTANASIGNAATAPFSNVLANLKPNTKYYCRAVMQNQYGTVKGEIVSFITKSKATSYVVKPTVPAKQSITKKATVKTNLVTCSDGSSFTSKNVSSATSATLLNQGTKLVTLQVEKADGKLVANGDVSYKVTYKNISDSRLTGVVIKVTLPAEITGVMATTGTFDDNTHTLTVNQDTIDPYSEGVITIAGKLAGNAPIGKTIVTTGYVVYTVPGTNAQDEVTAYVVGSIVPTDSIAKLDTGAKKVVGAGSDRGFMPSTLVEWLALIAIIAIIFILARSIYLSYQDDGGDAHGHH